MHGPEQPGIEELRVRVEDILSFRAGVPHTVFHFFNGGSLMYKTPSKLVAIGIAVAMMIGLSVGGG